MQATCGDLRLTSGGFQLSVTARAWRPCGGFGVFASSMPLFHRVRALRRPRCQPTTLPNGWCWTGRRCCGTRLSIKRCSRPSVYGRTALVVTARSAAWKAVRGDHRARSHECWSLGRFRRRCLRCPACRRCHAQGKELDELCTCDHIQPEEYEATYYVHVRASRPPGVSTMEPFHRESAR